MTRPPLPRTRPVLLALLVALSLALTACGFGGDSGAQQQPGGGAATKLVVGIGNEPQTFDVGKIKAGTDFYFATNMFEQLINRDPDGNLVPGLATSWTASPDGTSFDFQLRQGVKFQNGDPFTADDVVYTINDIIQDKQVAIPSYYTFLAGAEKVDDFHVRLKLKSVYPAALETLAMVTPI